MACVSFLIPFRLFFFFLKYFSQKSTATIIHGRLFVFFSKLGIVIDRYCLLANPTTIVTAN